MKKQKRLIVIVLALLLLATAGLFYVRSLVSNKEEEPVIVEPVKEIEPEVDEYAEKKELWKTNKAKNSDYVGQIYFESGLIDLPFVQGDTNDTYFRTNWETKSYDEEGSIFLDYRNSLYYDQNLIIYGHNVERSYEASGTHMFTPLHVLEDPEKYEENKYIDILLEDSVCRYMIAAVYRCGIYEENGAQYIKDGEPSYYLTDFTDGEFNDFYKKVKQNQYYDTGVDVFLSDKLLTLQTCISGSIDKFLVLAKLVETTYFD